MRPRSSPKHSAPSARSSPAASLRGTADPSLSTGERIGRAAVDGGANALGGGLGAWGGAAGGAALGTMICPGVGTVIGGAVGGILGGLGGSSAANGIVDWVLG